MVEATIQLPEETLRKIKALGVLRGSPDLDALIAQMVDKAVTNALLDEVLGSEGASARMSPLPPVQLRPQPEFTDLTGISSGLGDPEPEDETPAAPGKRKPRRPKAVAAPPPSDADLEHELEVDDPSTEAKVEAPSFADQMGGDAPTAEEAFGAAAGMPAPVRVPEPKRPSRRASINPKRVSAFVG